MDRWCQAHIVKITHQELEPLQKKAGRTKMHF